MTPWQYLVLAGLGAFHGINPGMGWAVVLATGLREGSRIASLRTLVPIAGGHALAVLTAAFLVSMLRSVVATQVVAIVGGAVLAAVGLWQAFSRRNDHAFGFRLSNAQLVSWSFLMSSIHGAGLALLPILVATPAVGPGGHLHGAVGTAAAVALWTGATATAVHTIAMVVVAGAIALLALDLTRVAVTRRRFGPDRVWAFALVGSGGVTVALGLLH